MIKYSRAHFTYQPSTIFQRSAQWLFGREPVLRRMPNGDLISLIYSGGKHEPAPENVVLLTRSTDDGATWSEPEILFEHPCRCTWGTEIFIEGPRVFLILHTYEYAGFFSELRAFKSFTDDNGLTWSEPVTLAGTPPNVAVRQGKVLSDGSWLFPVYWVEQTGTWKWSLDDGIVTHQRPGWFFRSGVIKSFDQGETFALSGYLNNGDHLLWEPEIIELEPGHLLMYLRSDGTGFLWTSESRDLGLTWTPPTKTGIPNSGSKFVMFKIGDAVVLVHNPESTGRSFMELWVTRDAGLTWPTKLRLAEIRDKALPEIDPTQAWQLDAEEPPPWVCYPHGFVDEEKGFLYLSCDSVDMHYFFKVPLKDFLG